MLVLIEKLASETRSTIAAFVEGLAQEFYGGRPERLDCDLWESRRFQGREFVRMVCPTSTFQEFLIRHASTGTGISRDTLKLDFRSGQPVACLIHRGQESECSPYEIETICERCRKNAAVNALSDIGPPGGSSAQRMWHFCKLCEDEFSSERERFMQEPPFRADMSKEQRQAAAEEWRQEINSHMSHWALGDQA